MLEASRRRQGGESFDELIFSQSKQSGRTRGEPANGIPDAYHYMVELPACGVATVSVPELNSRFCLKVIDWSVSERDTKRDRGGPRRDCCANP